MAYSDDVNESVRNRNGSNNLEIEGIESSTGGSSRPYRDDDSNSSPDEFLDDYESDFQVISTADSSTTSRKKIDRFRKDGIWKVYAAVGGILFLTLVLFVAAKKPTDHPSGQAVSLGGPPVTAAKQKSKGNSGLDLGTGSDIGSSIINHHLIPTAPPTNSPTPIPTTQNPTGTPSSNPSKVPTVNPTKTPRVKLTIESMKEYFTPVSGFQALQDTESPQFKTIQWIVKNGMHDLNEILDVYVLGTIYFSLNGPNWSERDNLLNQNVSVCEWNVKDSHGAYCNDSGTAAISKIIFSNNRLSGTIPTEIHYLSNLVELHLSYGSIHGTLPSEIGLLSNLDRLNLNYNRITGTIPTQIGLIGRNKHDNMTFSIRLDNNRLSGPIPSEIGGIRGLSKLQLNNNEFTGAFPANDLSRLPLLKILNVAQNNLGGNIHDFDFGSLSSLERISLHNNRFVGTIPSTIGLLPKETIKIIEFQNNAIHGTMPSEAGQLAKLEKFWVQDNLITGSFDNVLCVPNSFESLVARADSCDAATKKVTCACCCCGEFMCD